MSNDAKIYCWSSYDLPEDLLLALNENDWKEPLPIQAKSLKATLIEDKHVLGAARTGSGKTLAYAIPLLTRILQNRDNPCSFIKRKICKSIQKTEDFELIDGENVSIEELIVDKEKLHDIDLDDDMCEIHSDDESDQESYVTVDSTCDYSCPEAIILVPTRELAFQIRDVINKLCSNTDVRTCCLIGGLSQEKQLRALAKTKPEIVIATPGRLYDIVQSGEVKHLDVQSVASVRTLVIDEADRMVQKGHFQEMLKILDIIKESKKFRDKAHPFRVYLYSATLTFLHDLPDRLKPSIAVTSEKKRRTVDPKTHNKKNKINQMLHLLGIDRAETRVIDLNDESSFGRPSSDQLSEIKINCIAQEKDLFLYYFLVKNSNKKTLIFCNSKDCLRRLTNVLRYLKVNVYKLHADMDQKKRLSSLENFREKQNAVLVATDVAARGLDIKNLDCVVHYQVPRTCESYIHRSGRTARLTESGISLTLCEPKEVPLFKRLCNNINGGNDIPSYEIDLRLKKLLKSRVDMAQQCDRLDHQIREKKSDQNWFIKAAKKCDIYLDDEFQDSSETEEDAKKRRLLTNLQKQLDKLLKKKIHT